MKIICFFFVFFLFVAMPCHGKINNTTKEQEVTIQKSDSIECRKILYECEKKGFCSIQLEYPNDGNPNIVNAIRQWMVKLLDEKTSSHWTGALSSAEEMCRYYCQKYALENELSSCNIAVSKGYENNFFVSFIAVGSSGGASQWYWGECLTIDKRTGKKLDFRHFFQGDLRELTQIVYKDFANLPIDDEERKITDAIMGSNYVDFIIEGFHGQFVESIPISTIKKYISNEGLAVAGITINDEQPGPYRLDQSAELNQNKTKTDKLTYEMFLELYQAIDASKDPHRLPTKDILNRYNLKVKSLQREYDYSAIISNDVIVDSDNNLKALGPWWIEFYYGEDAPLYYLKFKGENEFNQFIALAEDYGLARMYAENYYSDEGLWDFTLAAINPIRGKVTRLLTEEQYHRFRVIGAFSYTPGSWQYGINLGFDLTFHVPDKQLSILNALSFVYYGNMNALYADGYKYRMKIGGIEYWTKACEIREGANGIYGQFEKDPSAASVIGIRAIDKNREVQIMVYSDKVKNDYLHQLNDLQLNVVNRQRLGEPTSRYFIETYKDHYVTVKVQTSDNREGAKFVITSNEDY